MTKAAAGLERIDKLPEDYLVLDWMLPAPAQGAIIVLAHEDNVDLQGILPARYRIYPKNSPLIVVAYGKAIEVKVGFAFSHCITIEKHFFGSFERFFVAHINRVILTFFITSLIPITVVAIRHRTIVLFNAAFHFGKERFLQRFGMCCLRLIVGIFGF